MPAKAVHSGLLLALLLPGAAAVAGESSIKFKPPSVSEEEQYSQVMPEQYRCDACRAAALAMDTKLREAAANPRNHHPKRKHPPGTLPFIGDAAVIEALETACSYSPGSPLAAYGVKNVDGVNMLSGPGVRGENLPGIVQGGGRWPARLSQVCQELLGAHDEDGIYSAHRASLKPGAKPIADFLCRAPCAAELGIGRQKHEDEL
eukprot:TRINITY_DN13893_c0_g1_i1.p2 TRINITY_DN13893_c0_g1~~TRINITY_DN13893_c0_g1_i1.p2  ORF type:complete len:231 (+),score=66.62 TRINITY_DN13893_c0_g1_i1:82-693(+)